MAKQTLTTATAQCLQCQASTCAANARDWAHNHANSHKGHVVIVGINYTVGEPKAETPKAETIYSAMVTYGPQIGQLVACYDKTLLLPRKTLLNSQLKRANAPATTKGDIEQFVYIKGAGKINYWVRLGYDIRREIDNYLCTIKGGEGQYDQS